MTQGVSLRRAAELSCGNLTSQCIPDYSSSSSRSSELSGADSCDGTDDVDGVALVLPDNDGVVSGVVARVGITRRLCGCVNVLRPAPTGLAVAGDSNAAEMLLDGGTGRIVPVLYVWSVMT